MCLLRPARHLYEGASRPDGHPPAALRRGRTWRPRAWKAWGPLPLPLSLPGREQKAFLPVRPPRLRGRASLATTWPGPVPSTRDPEVRQGSSFSPLASSSSSGRRQRAIR